MSKVIYFLFGEIDRYKTAEIFLSLLFFISLFTATCFFFDHRFIEIFGVEINFPVGLLFFPLTFVISNMTQDLFGRRAANTIVFCSFFADILLVSMSWVIANVGDRYDYYTVFNDLPIIMGATLVFLAISSAFNIFIYELLKKVRTTNIIGLGLSFFSSTTAAEILTSSMSMPLLFYKEGISGSILLSIGVIVAYKIIFNLVATLVYIMIFDKIKSYIDL
ncbi:VUT family protein [Thiotrichales bacterium 19S11-10]|nr:VUT family protein [Thiotrichales bacterium 19S11-10]